MNLFLNAVVGILLIFQVANSEAETDIGVGFNDDDDISCDPQIADTCFSDVNDDLRIIFNPNNNYFQTTNISLLRDLCSAWNDSLSCTSDIIDDGCQIADGRLKFDHWNEALRKTFEFVCKEDLRVLQDLFHSIRCFNISAFFNCVEKTANLKTVQDLMATNLDITECKYIQKVIQKCGEYVTADTCALEVLEPLDNIFGTFFDAADCSRSKSFEPKREASTNNGATTNQILTPVLVFIMSVLYPM